ncbi:MAG: glycosyltransferase family 2 protein, partial [Bacteroidota bacterium]|nr:glycosyltransferase family 2 protein [Bacteroidota bacterium]
EGITQKATAYDLTHLLSAHIRALRQIIAALKRRRHDKGLSALLPAYYEQVLNIQLDVYHACGRLSKDFPILPYRNTLKLKLLHILGLKRLCQLHKIFRYRH